MNVDIFIQARKDKGLSQIELSEGICTQTTLSRFENNGNTPSLKILMALCDRLDFPIGDLFPKVGVVDSVLKDKLDTIEFLLITSEYEKALELLKGIPSLEDEDLESRLRLNYLEGFLMIYTDASINDIFFKFDQVLLESETSDCLIYRLLAFTGNGMIHLKNNDKEKANYYFTKVLSSIYTYTARTTEDIWRILHILFQSGVFYTRCEDYTLSNTLLEYGVRICSDNHITYYLARIVYQLALNAVAEELDTVKIIELINEARAFAKINRNENLLREIDLLERKVSEEQ